MARRTYVVVLGSGTRDGALSLERREWLAKKTSFQGVLLNDHAEYRVIRGIDRIRVLQQRGEEVGGMLFTSGFDGRITAETIAEAMARYANAIFIEAERDEHGTLMRVPLIANDDGRVRGLRKEMAWACDRVHETCGILYRTRLEFVAEPWETFLVPIVNYFAMRMPDCWALPVREPSILGN
ncbi:MAG TPA: hypothetical protein VFS75_00185 [Candidatus Paceibacterota bacterium]|nr:hypothetical protein [Candidatus Paceibacterota bacterium]